ncbi:hypothetical protein ccbrp13_24590 [Ktedonobacteria bacterium brp13]|nr:hypothetical protein ccbrp13_24590 [Ktedonobacteria bacterium brp13]
MRPTQVARSQDANATPWFGLEDQRPSSAGTPSSPSNPGFPDMPSTPRPVAGQRPRMRKYNVARDNSPWSEGSSAEDVRDGAGSSPAQPAQDAAAVNWPGPLTHVVAEEQPQQNAARSSFPVLPDTPRPVVDDVPTVAWKNEPATQPEQKDTSKDTPIEDLPTSTWKVDQAAPVQNKDAAIEDLPTSALKVEHRDQKAADIDIVRGNSLAGQPDRAKQPEPPAHFRPPVAPAAVPQAFSDPTIVSRPFPAAAASPPPRVAPAPVPPVAQGPSSQPYFQSAAPGQSFAQGTSAVQPPAAPVRPVQPAMRSMPVGSSKRTILIAVLAIIVVAAIAIGSWILTAKPFNVPPETQPLQTATNSTLGVTLQYPTGWLASTSGATWTLSDSSKTDQVLLTQAAAPATSDLTGTLNQEAKQLGMSSPKVGASVAFGNSTWFQIQGGLQLQGASYTGTIYNTVHNGHLYTLTMMAPQSTFADVERVVFAHMRSSLAFQ